MTSRCCSLSYSSWNNPPARQSRALHCWPLVSYMGVVTLSILMWYGQGRSIPSRTYRPSRTLGSPRWLNASHTDTQIDTLKTTKRRRQRSSRQRQSDDDMVVSRGGICWRGLFHGGWQEDPVNEDHSHHDEDDDTYDDVNEYDEDEIEQERSRRRPPPPTTTTRRPPYRSRPTHSRPPYPTPQQRRHRRRPTSAPSSILSYTAVLAKKSVGLTTTLASTALKSSGKAAYYLVSPKHVHKSEVWGVWRLDQQVIDPSTSTTILCAANVEFTPQGLVLTKYQQDNQGFDESTYIFSDRRTWPQSCVIQFEARAFQDSSNDSGPVAMRYKGYFRRKLADPSVIKIVGNIYPVARKRRGLLGLGSGGGSGREGTKVGTFVARRRIAAVRSKNDKDEGEENYDSDEEEDAEDDDEDNVDDLSDWSDTEDELDEYDSDDMYDDDDDGD